MSFHFFSGHLSKLTSIFLRALGKDAASWESGWYIGTEIGGGGQTLARRLGPPGPEPALPPAELLAWGWGGGWGWLGWGGGGGEGFGSSGAPSSALWGGGEEGRGEEGRERASGGVGEELRVVWGGGGDGGLFCEKWGNIELVYLPKLCRFAWCI